MSTQNNAVTGKLQVSSTLKATFDDPTSLESELNVEFIQDLFNGDSVKNMRRYGGTYTPNNDALTIAEFVGTPPTYQPKYLLLHTSLPVGLDIQERSIALGLGTRAYYNTGMCRGFMFLNYPQKFDYYIAVISLRGETASYDTDDVAQGTEIKYVLYTWEKV